MSVTDTGPIDERRPQWPVLVATDNFEIRIAETQAELEAAQRVRYRVFYEELGAVPTPAMEANRLDFDKYDPFCDHLLAVDRSTVDEDGQPAVMGCYRLLRNEGALRAGGFYTSGEFDISKLSTQRPKRRAADGAGPVLRRQGIPHPADRVADAVEWRHGLCRAPQDRRDVRLRLVSRHRSQIRGDATVPICIISIRCAKRSAPARCRASMSIWT